MSAVLKQVPSSVAPLLVARHGVSQPGATGGGRVLVALAGQDRVGGGPGDGGRAVDAAAQAVGVALESPSRLGLPTLGNHKITKSSQLEDGD
jgi:hypothetical protein